jgi:hypothetical protein
MFSCSRLPALSFHFRVHLLRAPNGLSRIPRRYLGTEAATVYYGPLSRTFRNLKIFSLTSFGLASSMTPLFFMIESTLPVSARVALAATTLTASGISTAFVSWTGAPYVNTLRKLPEDMGIEMETTTLFLKSRYTTVYDSSFLRDTGRLFAKWELADAVEGAKGQAERAETVAETKDGSGNVVGRWIVQWKNGRGECRGVGRVIRYVWLAKYAFTADL